MQYGYNARGYLSTLTDIAASPNVTLRTVNAADAYGNTTDESYGNGHTTLRGFDAVTGWLESIDTSSGGNVLQDNTYEWQSNGILESRAKQVGATAYSEVFQHDGLNRLEQSQTYIGGVLSRTLSSSYDIRGNLSAKTSDVLNDIDVTSYNYTAGSNRLASATIGGVSTTFTMDNNGNITRYDRASGEDKFIDWNARNMPTTVVIGSSLTDTTPTAKDEFAYGPDGQRYYKKTSWDDSGTQRVEHTFYVGAFEELITDSSNPSYKAIKKTRVDSSAMHIRRTDWNDVSTDAIEYLHRDHLGSVEVTSNSAGTALDQRGYDPFGGRRATDWTRELTAAEKKAIADGSDEPAERGYTDHEMLDRTGLIHMNGRVYDPEIGRFLSPDPIVQAPGYSQSWNRYAYVMNSPMSYTDPSGYIRQPSSAGDICAASPVCLNMNDSNGGPSGGSTSYGVPSTRISVTIFEERRLGSSEDIFWPRVFGGGFGRGIPGGNDRFGLPGLIDRILRIEIDNVELINRRVETRSTRVVSTTESSETDEAIENESGEPAQPRFFGFFAVDPNDEFTEEESTAIREASRRFDVQRWDSAVRPDTANCPFVIGCEMRVREVTNKVSDVISSPITTDDYDELPEGVKDVLRQAKKAAGISILTAIGRRSFCEILNPCNLITHPQNTSTVPPRRSVDAIIEDIERVNP